MSDEKRSLGDQEAVWEAYKEWTSLSRMRDMTDRITMTANDHALHASSLGEDVEDVEAFRRILERRGIDIPTRARRRPREND